MRPKHIEIEPGYLSPREAAQYLSISHKSLENMRRRGDGPRFCKPTPRMVRYARSELDAWMTRHLLSSTCEEVQR